MYGVLSAVKGLEAQVLLDTLAYILTKSITCNCISLGRQRGIQVFAGRPEQHTIPKGHEPYASGVKACYGSWASRVLRACGRSVSVLIY